MAVIKPVVIASKTIKGGKNKVRISIAHNGETRYLVTDIIIDSNKEFKNGMVVKRHDAAILNTKIRKLLQRYQTALDEIEYINGLTCPELVQLITNRGNNANRTLISVYEEYIDSLNIAESTKLGYRTYWNNIKRQVGEDTRLENITPSTVLNFKKHLQNRKLKPGTIYYILYFFMSIFGYARRCGYIPHQLNPFIGIRLPKPGIRQAWLTVDEVKRIRDVSTHKRNILKCRDLFMLSYYLGGINITDLLDINFNQQKDILTYVRKKTKGLMKINDHVEFYIPDEAKEIIDRIKGRDGLLSVTKADRNTMCHLFFYNNMPKLAEAAGVKNLIYYSARKSFAQHAFNLGISTSVIDYILGHKVNKGCTSLYNYIYVTPEIATSAVRKVLDNLK